jgi:hypothetical protein
MVPLPDKSKLISMKKILLLSIVTFLSLATFAQPWSGNSANTTLQVRVGNIASVTPPVRYFDSVYYLMFNLSDTTLYRYTYKNQNWVKVFSGGGGGGGSSNNIYNTDSLLAGNRTVTLNGYTLKFDAATRNRSFQINMTDSNTYFNNFTGKWVMDSINGTTKTPILWLKSSSSDAESPDFYLGHYMTTKNGGNREEEDYSFGYNLKADGTRANTSLPAMGWLYNFNRYATSALNHNIYLTAIDSAGTQVNVMNYNFLPATGVKSGTITWSSNNVNYINPAIPSNAGYGTYYKIGQNLIELIGLTPKWRLTDTSNASYHGDIYFNSQDLFIVPNRYLYLNGTVKLSIGALFTAASTSSASFNVAAGTAPTSPGDGDVWNASSTHHLFTRLNGTTYQLDQQATSATYTPTLTNTTNIGSSAFSSASYILVGNTVHVMITGSFTPSAANTSTRLTFTLPVTSSNGSQTNIGMGVVAENSGGTSFDPGTVTVRSTTTASFDCYPSATTSVNFSVIFQYQL